MTEEERWYRHIHTHTFMLQIYGTNIYKKDYKQDTHINIQIPHQYWKLHTHTQAHTRTRIKAAANSYPGYKVIFKLD